MKQEKSLLMENLNLRLISLNNTGRIKELINSDLLNDYMPKGVLTKYLNTKMPLNNLNTSELFHITRLINLYEHKINVDEYFTDTEINEAMESKNNLKIELNPVIELKDVLYSKTGFEESWLCVVAYREIYEWMKSGVLSYRLETQRRGIFRKIGKEKMVMPYVNEKSIQEMKKDMKEDRFYSNLLSFNIIPDYNHKLQYDKFDKILRIDTTLFDVDIIDGFHRISAVMLALDEDKDLQGNFYLKITNMSIEKAQQFIIQEAKGNVQDLDYLEKYNPTNKIRMFIDNINSFESDKTNVLFRKIDMGVNNKDCWILYETFKEGLSLAGYLDDINNTNSNTEIRQIEKFIVKWFYNFYETAKENNIDINDNDILTDPTFIMGLLITSYRYLNKNKIDNESMDKFIKKIKTSKTKYIYNMPMIPKEKRNMLNKFSKLLEDL